VVVFDAWLSRLEFLVRSDHDNLHHFYHALVNSHLFWSHQSVLTREQILAYEENIVRHTRAVNEKRHRPVVWKYYQWLTLLFVEIYLDRFFGNPEGLLNDLNAFVERFNRHWHDYADVPPYSEDDLNKLCMQNATGSGKTLLMHVNLRQYRHYTAKHGKDKTLSRVILLTPNERLSGQHIAEFRESSIQADSYLQSRGGLFSLARGLDRVDVLEITKLADQEGPNTIATRSLGDQNLLLVDEGHRGLSGKQKEKEEQNAWFRRRSQLCEKGFTFEYSATFEQAVVAAKNSDFENTYAKTVVFDYSYRWFYEDGFGKDYQILNLPESFEPMRFSYMTACLLEGWDCWRVSTMGLMHVGRSEGSQIIQLFGRGVRLKGYEWSLKRSGHSHAPVRPDFIEELETLNVFGIEADFMEKFRQFLKEEGLPGNERRKTMTIPLNVTYDFGKRLKILRPKRKASDGREYDFKKDAPVPTVGEVPDYMTQNKVVVDWYPRIQAVRSRGAALTTQKDRVFLSELHLALLNYDTLFFELEQFKRERSWHNLNITKNGIKHLLRNPGWYTLYLAENRLNPATFDGVLLLQQVASELLKRYCVHYYNYRKREYIEPRLELRDLKLDDDNIPQDEFYRLIVDGDEEQVIQGIQQIKKDLEQKKDDLLKVGDLYACNFGKHLFQPVFHVRRGGKIIVLPVALNESEYQFISDLKTWCDDHKSILEADGMEFFLLRNQSRGKGVGFFEAGNFHPDFILWLLAGKKQYVSFIEPHGLLHEGPASEKVLFHKRIKDVEQRLNDPAVILNSFILSWTQYAQLQWDNSREVLEDMHVLFMTDDRDRYIDKLFDRLRGDVEIRLKDQF
jgi:hypothetical protein